MNNEMRAKVAQGAIDTMEGAIQQSNEENLTDLLTNLMHWAISEDIDFEVCACSAQSHFEEERDTEKTRPDTGTITAKSACGSWHPYCPSEYVIFTDQNGFGWMVGRKVYNRDQHVRQFHVGALIPVEAQMIEDGYLKLDEAQREDFE